jgi:hypothetical protein
MSAGEVNVRARNADGDTSNAVVFTVQSSGSRFIRGDANLDGVVDISDPLRLLFHLFEEATLDCEDAADADNNEALNLADVLYLLNFTFQAGPAPPAPFPNPGSDPAAAGPLGCL